MNNWFEGMPEVVKVGPFRVRIEIKSVLNDEDNWGEFDDSPDERAEYVIRFKYGQPTRRFALDTVLHEVSHAVFRTFGLNDGETEERICTVLAVGWGMILRENPELAKWIGAAAQA
jgi:hypothetical protein